MWQETIERTRLTEDEQLEANRFDLIRMPAVDALPKKGAKVSVTQRPVFNAVVIVALHAAVHDAVEHDVEDLTKAVNPRARFQGILQHG